MDARMRVVTQANKDYARFRNTPSIPVAQELRMWWISHKGGIDRVMFGDVDSMQLLDATLTLGCMC
jgi:hypothetical protein